MSKQVYTQNFNSPNSNFPYLESLFLTPIFCVFDITELFLFFLQKKSL